MTCRGVRGVRRLDLVVERLGRHVGAVLRRKVDLAFEPVVEGQMNDPIAHDAYSMMLGR